MAKLFISYRMEDEEYRNALNGILRNPSAGFTDTPIIDRKNMTKKGEDAIRAYLNGLIKECSAVLLLVGNNTHNGPWVKHEIAVALSLQKKITPIRIPDTTGGLPSILKKERLHLTEWNPAKIKAEIENIFGR